jgi:POT family proton-dependent oligopeptide transporter
MGLYFAMTGFGGKLAGYLGEVSSAWGTNYVFIIITLFTYFLAFLMFCFENTLLKYMH